MTRTAIPTASDAGAKITAAMGRAYEAIRADHPELPAHVMFITGTGADGRGLRWGHFHGDLWASQTIELRHVGGQAGRLASIGRTRVRIAGHESRVHEVFISGERLAEGAELTFQTLVHESAHALGHARGVVNCSRNRHLAAFRTLAEELGMTYPHETAHKTMGYSQVILTDATKARYAAVIADLAGAIVTYLDTFKRQGITVAPGGGTEGRTSIVKAPRQGKDRNYVATACGCGHKVRMSRPMVERAIVRCDDCGELFTEQ